MNKYNIALCAPKVYVNKLEKLLAPLYIKADRIIHVEGKKWVMYWDYVNNFTYEHIKRAIRNLEVPYYDFISLSEEGTTYEEHSEEDAPYILGIDICYYHKGNWIGL